ncbi:hypothetical protein F5884DRAFT_857986 [Xylogone sp. PMI_703]|nr:hypothetical protein F5884DRAFT_857986 [Xylogone sp. PMI_703]
MSQTNSQGAQWPPRSPHDVLLSTPKGRERLRRLAERTSPSPSPTRKSTSTPLLENRTKRLLASGLGALSDPEEEEEDEETLQLQLQEIQARLKLKRLQKRAAQASEIENKDDDRIVPPERARSAAGIHTQSKSLEAKEYQRERSQSNAGINVPASPIKRLQPAEAPRSPSRVLLGIDKGWKGSDVSLRKAPSLRRDDGIGSQASRNAGPYLHRSRSQASIYGNQDSRSSLRQDEAPRPKSFSERIAAMRAEEAARREKEARAKINRSTAFDINQEEMEQYKKTATTLPETPYQPPEFSREEVLASFNKTSAQSLSRSRALSSPQPSAGSSSDIPITKSTTETSSNPAKRSTSRRSTRKPAEVPETEATQFEPYSSQHLSKRILPHQVVTRTFSGKKTYVVPDLLKVVKAPEYNPPEIEDDWVLLGVVAWKSEPKSKQDGSKYLVIKVTDLKWELDLFLFDSAFTRFWKLTVGTVIAILNPNIWAPPKGKIDTGHFSLTLNSSEDTILEIGSSRDLGFCKSVKKDGNECGSWVDKRHTEFCDYHVNTVLDKTKSKRPEVNSMDFGRGPKYGDRKYQRSQDMTWHMKNKEEEKAYTKTHGTYDRSVQSHFFVSGRTPANLLDDVDYDPDAFHRGMSKEERLRKQLVTQERERELARKLGETGTGAGAVYLRSREKLSNPNPSSSTNNTTSESADSPPAVRNAASLGLLKSRGSATSIHLSPMKRKRALTGGNGGDSASSSFSSTASTAVANSSTATATVTTTTTTGPLGWGSNLTKELSRMKNGESLSQQQPVKKKTRFVTAKGIREAGRDSFGGEVVGKASITSIASAATASSSTSSNITKTIRGKPAVIVTPDDDDSNDDLDIIR